MGDDEAVRKAAAIQAYRQKLMQHTEIDGKVWILKLDDSV
jgi:hypothetical protein